MKEIKLPADIDRLGDLYAFLQESIACGGVVLPECKYQELKQASEEIFVNIAYYAYTGRGDVLVRIEAGPTKIKVEFHDSGKAFDPLAFGYGGPSPHNPAHNRGGQGIFLVKELTDDFYYTYCDGHNKLTIVKAV
ncbi:MAG: ATP-binding protein [Defluviitaleaceae bacterium]|nr:ATP-binding protein [Defluviitaleaceae bacterium]MCL2239663.1 ATP-binding protein [Defluviitaleaceae bacterium]